MAGAYTLTLRPEVEAVFSNCRRLNGLFWVVLCETESKSTKKLQFYTKPLETRFY